MSGGVVMRSASLNEYENYDWAILPFEVYLHGFASRDLAALAETRKLQRAIEGHDFTADDATIVAAFDTAPDKSRLNLFCQNLETAPDKSRLNFFYQKLRDGAKRVERGHRPLHSAVTSRSG